MTGLPQMVQKDGIRKWKQTRFLGYNHTDGAADGALWDMENLTGDRFPLLATRKPRRYLHFGDAKILNPNGFYIRDKVYWVSGNTLYADGQAVEGLELENGTKRFASIGAYIIILPDMKYYNALDGSSGSLGAKLPNAKCRITDGTYAGKEAKGNTIRAVSDSVDFTEHFRLGDTVTISGASYAPENNKQATIREIEKNELRFYENSFAVREATPEIECRIINSQSEEAALGDMVRAMDSSIDFTGYFHAGDMVTVLRGGESLDGATPVVVAEVTKSELRFAQSIFSIPQDTAQGTCRFTDGVLGGKPVKGNTIAAGDSYTISENVGVDFRQWIQPGDIMAISGAAGFPENNKTLPVLEVEKTKLRFAEDSFVTEKTIPAKKYTCMDIAPFKTLAYSSLMNGGEELDFTDYFQAGDTVMFTEYGTTTEDASGGVISSARTRKLTLAAVEREMLTFTEEISVGPGTIVAEISCNCENKMITLTRVSGEKLVIQNGRVITMPDCKFDTGVDDDVIQQTGNTANFFNFGDYFQAGDQVVISGAVKHPENNKALIIKGVVDDGDDHALQFEKGGFTVYQPDAATGGVSGDNEENVTLAVWNAENLTIQREIPEMDYMCENENRLWGCKGDMIYGSRQGDPFNWNTFDGIATDSYQVMVGSAGDFTGCCSFLGYPHFFKEDHIYKLYGNRPANFQLASTACLGVAKGSGESLAIAGQTLFYLSRTGIAAYNGAAAQGIYDAFGTDRYRNAVGGSDGVKYYVSMKNEKGDYSLFVYDSRKNLWHREDGTQAVGFGYKDGFYCLDANGALWMRGEDCAAPGWAQDGAAESMLTSFAEFADFYDDIGSAAEYGANRAGTGKLQVRLELEDGAQVDCSIKFDSDDDWQKVCTLQNAGGKKRSYYLPIVPRRSDHYRLRFEGQGGWKLYSLAREEYSGSEL